MNDYEYYKRMIEQKCNGCPAYEEIGHCGTYSGTCELISLYDFLSEIMWDDEYFVGYIYYHDYLEGDDYFDDSRLLQEYYEDMEAGYALLSELAL